LGAEVEAAELTESESRREVAGRFLGGFEEVEPEAFPAAARASCLAFFLMLTGFVSGV